MATTFSPRIVELLRTEHRVSQTKLGSLSTKDVSDLRSVASGRTLPDQRVKALGLLAATGGASVAAVLRAALTDRTASPEVRAAGATWLSRAGTKSAANALLASLAVEEEAAVAHKIVAGLARKGDAGTIKRLAAQSAHLPAGVREHADFVGELLACRWRLAGRRAPPVADAARLPAPANAPELAIGAARPEDALRTIDQIRADSFGVVGSHDSVALLQCGGRQLALVAGDPLRGPLADLLARPSLPAVVAEQAEADGSYSLAWVVLAWPDGAGGLRLSVNRPSGRTLFVGSAHTDGDALAVQLDAVAGPGAIETSIAGTIQGGRLDGLQVRTGRSTPRLQPTLIDS